MKSRTSSTHSNPRILLGIGNTEKGDDGVGPYVASLLENSTWYTVDAGVAPENFTGVVRRHRPGLVVMVDAADMGLPPGAIRRLPVESLKQAGLDTHTLPLSLLAHYLEQFCPRVVIIGIQPEHVFPGRGLSPRIKKAAQELAALLASGRLEEIPVIEKNP